MRGLAPGRSYAPFVGAATVPSRASRAVPASAATKSGCIHGARHRLGPFRAGAPTPTTMHSNQVEAGPGGWLAERRSRRSAFGPDWRARIPATCSAAGGQQGQRGRARSACSRCGSLRVNSFRCSLGYYRPEGGWEQGRSFPLGLITPEEKDSLRVNSARRSVGRSIRSRSPPSTPRPSPVCTGYNLRARRLLNPLPPRIWGEHRGRSRRFEGAFRTPTIPGRAGLARHAI
jgi:hypothetical protein